MLFYNKLCYVAFCYITLLYCNKMAWYNPSGTGRLNMVYQYLGLCSDILYMVPHEMTFVVCEFHITSHLLCLASGGGTTNSLLHVLYTGISYSSLCVYWTLNSTQSIISWSHLSMNEQTKLMSKWTKSKQMNEWVSDFVNQSVKQSTNELVGQWKDEWINQSMMGKVFATRLSLDWLHV